MKVHLPVRKAILNRRTYEAPAEGRSDKLRLDFNENTSGCSPEVRGALAKLSTKQLAMYPEYQSPTRRIARYFGVRAEELLLTNGGDDALSVFFDTFVGSGNGILICEPTFQMYRYYAEIYGARISVLRYGSEMEFPLEGVIAALRKKPRVLFIANPNNPTGTLLQKEELRKIFKAATHTAVVMDEAYAEFSGFSAIPLIRKNPQLFVARTFSKVAGLAALRLGAVIACKESLVLVRKCSRHEQLRILANPRNGREAGEFGIRFIHYHCRVSRGFKDFPQLFFLQQSPRRIIGIGDKENARLFPQSGDHAFERKFHFAAVAKDGNPRAVYFRVVAVHWKSRLANQDAPSNPNEGIQEYAQILVATIGEQQFFRAHTEVTRNPPRLRLMFGII